MEEIPHPLEPSGIISAQWIRRQNQGALSSSFTLTAYNALGRAINPLRPRCDFRLRWKSWLLTLFSGAPVEKYLKPYLVYIKTLFKGQPCSWPINYLCPLYLGSNIHSLSTKIIFISTGCTQEGMGLDNVKELDEPVQSGALTDVPMPLANNIIVRMATTKVRRQMSNWQ